MRPPHLRFEDRTVDNFLNSSINTSGVTAHSQKTKERRALSNDGATVEGIGKLPKVRNGRPKPQTSQPPPVTMQL